ncbi:MAG: hypothetical protein LBF71_04535 [Campylobacteraceae bacterium]|jgi:hypothetical protein|nr:hypothetical protein [Campylobacteraceae bacterium]
MAGCSCDAGGKSAAEKIAGLFICAKTHQCFVTHIVEKALPILFWLGILGSFVVAFNVADILSHFIGVFSAILTFFVVLIIAVILTFLTFYTIYLLKAIKDNLKSDETECGCNYDGNTEPKKEVVKSKAVDKTAPKKRGRKPSVKPTV